MELPGWKVRIEEEQRGDLRTLRKDMVLGGYRQMIRCGGQKRDNLYSRY